MIDAILQAMRADCVPGPQTMSIAGQRFGRLVVIEFAGYLKGRNSRWKCLCDCGNDYIVRGSNLLKGWTKSCFTCALKIRKARKSFGEIPGWYWGSLVCGARRRGLPFTVTIEKGWQLFLDQQRRCAFSSVPLCFPETKAEGFTGVHNASFDRINDGGYVPGNVQWVHKILNRMKMDMQNQEFIDWCKLVARTH